MPVTSEWSAYITHQLSDPLYIVFKIQKMHLFCFGSFSININIKQLLNTHLQQIMNTFQPDFIFYQSGVDILESDKLGKMGCSLDGCKQRDLVVFSIAKQHDIPVQCSMGGGYSPDVSTIVQAHANTFLSAVEVFL